MIDIGKDLQNAYEEGYKQGRYDEKVETEMSLPQRWIPCSERLPEQDQICLVCGKKGGIYVTRFWTNGKVVLWTKTGTGKFVTAIAWMPLPEPYRGESE